jgi:Fur family transcriptional regulator, ferric uptake regulator
MTSLKKQDIQLTDSLTQRGFRMTPQRELLLSILAKAAKHLTADEILAQVHRTYPRLNKSVVYRNLELLTELGLISRVDLGQGHVEYEVHRHPHHHHLVCRRCKATLEITSETFATLQHQLLERYGFVADLDHLAIFGLCQSCQAKPDPLEEHHPHEL